MGNVVSSQPKNKTGKNVVRQKLENAKKTGVLSLREHKLSSVPDKVYELSDLRTLDLSKNNLKIIEKSMAGLLNLKSLNCDENKLVAGSLAPVSHLSKLQILSAGGNKLGAPIVTDPPTKITPEPLPQLPKSLKQLKVDFNVLHSVPKSIYTSGLTRLEKLDMSSNYLAALPSEIGTLVSLIELNLDNNSIVSLPKDIGSLKKLKVLSLKHNKIRVDSIHFSPQNPQPIPASLFAETPVIDLNLHGNAITNTQINEFEGFSKFLERRKSVKSKNIYGGALTDLDLCGLE